MKKLFYVLAIAAFATACNNGEKKTEDVKPVDSATVAPAKDSAMVDSASMAKPDSAAAAK